MTAGFAGDCIVSQLAVDYLLTMVRDTGFEPVTPTVSRYSALLDCNSSSVGDSIWGHAKPCENEKCYSELLQWFFLQQLCRSIRNLEAAIATKRRGNHRET